MSGLLPALFRLIFCANKGNIIIILNLSNIIILLIRLQVPF